jgi:hypothetical protein
MNAVINLFPRDKWAHILIGIVVYTLGALAAHALGAPWHIGIAVGFAFTYIAAVGKELYDSFRPSYHTQDVWDALATGMGGVIVATVDVFVQLWMTRL